MTGSELVPGKSDADLQIEVNVGHYGKIYRACLAEAKRIVAGDPPSPVSGAVFIPYGVESKVAKLLFNRFCDDQQEALKVSRIMDLVRSALPNLGRIQ